MLIKDSRNRKLDVISTLNRILKSTFTNNVSAVAAAVIVGVATVAGSVVSAQGAKSAANTEAGAAESANALNYQEFQTQQQNIAPWIAAGTGALQTLQKGSQPGGQFNQTFTAADFNQSPELQFAEQQGDQAINNNSASKGMSYSPATAQALSAYNVGEGGQFFNTSFNQFMEQEGTALSEQETLAGYGEQGVQQSNQASQNYATTAGNNIMSAGNAIAAGQIASSNAIGQGIGELGNDYLTASFISKLTAAAPAA